MGVSKDRSACCQTVNVGRANLWVPVQAANPIVLVVNRNEQYVEFLAIDFLIRNGDAITKRRDEQHATDERLISKNCKHYMTPLEMKVVVEFVVLLS